MIFSVEQFNCTTSISSELYDCEQSHIVPSLSVHHTGKLSVTLKIYKVVRKNGLFLGICNCLTAGIKTEKIEPQYKLVFNTQQHRCSTAILQHLARITLSYQVVYFLMQLAQCPADVIQQLKDN